MGSSAICFAERTETAPKAGFREGEEGNKQVQTLFSFPSSEILGGLGQLFSGMEKSKLSIIDARKMAKDALPKK